MTRLTVGLFRHGIPLQFSPTARSLVEPGLTQTVKACFTNVWNIAILPFRCLAMSQSDAENNNEECGYDGGDVSMKYYEMLQQRVDLSPFC